MHKSGDGGVIKRSENGIYVCRGCWQTRFRQRKMMRRTVQLKPLILSVVSGLQLLGMQLCLASVQVNLFWTPHHFHKLNCTQYAGFARCFDLVEVAANGCDLCFQGFFFSHALNGSLRQGLSTGQAWVNLMWQSRKFTSELCCRSKAGFNECCNCVSEPNVSPS